MSNPWDAEFSIDQQQAAQVITEQFSELLPLQIQPFGKGWDNTAFLVNERWIFRFPRRPLAVSLMMHEINLLPQLHQHQLPLEIPSPIYIGKASKQYPHPFAGYALISGITGCCTELSRQQRQQSARSLGQFLKHLHQVNPDTFWHQDAPILTSIRKRFFNITTYLDKISARPSLSDQVDIALLSQFIATIPKPSMTTQNQSLALIHGDLYARHLVFDLKKTLCGIIDWGDMELGYIASDLAVAHSFLPMEAHEDFLSAYGKVTTETWQLAKALAIYSSAVITIYGLDINDDKLHQEGMQGLAFILEALN